LKAGHLEAIKRYPSALSARQWSLLLTGFAILLWAYSLVQTKLKLDGYGLVHSYPVTFFISLGILTIASAILWVSKEKSGKLLFLQLLFLIISLWLTPLLIGGIGNSQPSLGGTVGEYGYSEYIARIGHFSPEISWRLNWPGIYTLSAEIIQISGKIEPYTILSVFPFISHIIFLVPIFLLFKNTLSSFGHNYHWAAIWVFYVGIWDSGGFLHTQTLANFFIFSILALFTVGLIAETISRNIIFYLSYIVLIAGLTITHLFTSIFALIISAAFWITKMLKNPAIIIFSAIVIAGWMIYGTMAFFGSRFSLFIEQAFRLDTIFGNSISGRLKGMPVHQTVIQIRLIITIFFVVIGVIGFFVARKNKISSDSIMFTIAGSALVLLVILGAAYGFEAPQRTLIFLMVPIAYYVVRFLTSKMGAIVITIALIMILPLNVISHYGNQASDYLSPSTIQAVYYFRDHTIGGCVVANNSFGAVNNIENYQFYSFENMLTEQNPLSKIPEYPVRYIVFTTQEQSLFSLIYNKPNYDPMMRLTLNNMTSYNLVYENPDVTMYFYLNK